MRSLTFRGGIHPLYLKEMTSREPVRDIPIPPLVILPLSQHIGAPNDPEVKKGDIVEEGQRIGSCASFISSPLHSPVHGKVTDIKKAFHPVLGPTVSIFIEPDMTKKKKAYEKTETEELTSEEIIGRVRDAGIVGMGGAAFPTHVKLSVPEGKKIDTLIINGAECEPYLTCDDILMTGHTSEILKGIEIVMKVLSFPDTYIAIEDNKKEAISAFKKEIKESRSAAVSGINVISLRTKYPQGGEKPLIKAITGREVPPGKLPLDIGCIVQNVDTAKAVYEAVALRKPLTDRIITVSGDLVKRPGNYRVAVGTTIKDLAENCGVDLSEEPYKIIMGGPMMGISQPGTETPVIKSTSGVLFLSDDKPGIYEEQPCIRCAKCVDVCPVELAPTDIMRNVKKMYWDRMEDLRVPDCMECGCCAYSCPSRIPLVQYIKDGKVQNARMKRK